MVGWEGGREEGSMPMGKPVSRGIDMTEKKVQQKESITQRANIEKSTLPQEPAAYSRLFRQARMPMSVILFFFPSCLRCSASLSRGQTVSLFLLLFLLSPLHTTSDPRTFPLSSLTHLPNCCYSCCYSCCCCCCYCCCCYCCCCCCCYCCCFV